MLSFLTLTLKVIDLFSEVFTYSINWSKLTSLPVCMNEGGCGSHFNNLPPPHRKPEIFKIPQYSPNACAFSKGKLCCLNQLKIIKTFGSNSPYHSVEGQAIILYPFSVFPSTSWFQTINLPFGKFY